MYDFYKISLKQTEKQQNAGSFDNKLQGTLASKLSILFTFQFSVLDNIRRTGAWLSVLWESTISKRYKTENWEYWAQLNRSYTEQLA